jgi:hypothetical protein
LSCIILDKNDCKRKTTATRSSDGCSEKKSSIKGEEAFNFLPFGFHIALLVAGNPELCSCFRSGSRGDIYTQMLDLSITGSF